MRRCAHEHCVRTGLARRGGVGEPSVNCANQHLSLSSVQLYYPPPPPPLPPLASWPRQASERCTQCLESSLETKSAHPPLVNYSIQEIKSGIDESMNLLLSAVGNETADNRANYTQSLLERIAFKSCKSLQESEDLSTQATFENTVKSMKDKGITSALVSFLQAIQTMKASPDNKRLIKHLLATSLDQVDTSTELGYLSSTLRQELLSLLRDSKKETDQQMVKGLLDDANAKQDWATAAYYKRITSC
ncbi:hypothetical protein ElyMa_004082000 [Elysia marginata]|uniref:Vitellogenin domain-containing protein n=1 Tax=Elysia marginata TaxID=1093978 RepID=A0AAV4G8W2_9GAST|nr:hypothetical protein ElyMa_004082000 [Elysia marginata]